MSGELKTYSVLINWHDRDPEQGTFGATVRAINAGEAERLARIEMAASDAASTDAEPGEEPDPETTGGSVVDLNEGAVWMASQLEAALRAALDGDLEPARKVIDEIDKIGGGA